MKNLVKYMLAAAILVIPGSCKKGADYKALIITGQNVTRWEVSSESLRTMLEESGLFKASLVISPSKGSDLSSFRPDFKKYDVVVVDYRGDIWPDETKKAFVSYIREGGGAVIYHESSRSFPEWAEYGEINGLSPVSCDSVPSEYEVRTRLTEHPVMKGLPVRWLHATDHLFSVMTGPGNSTEVLATAYSNPSKGGSGKDEPVLMAVSFGKGRVFNTTIGCPDVENGTSLQCAGFITTFQRGAEWAASGQVTQEVPSDFPSAATVSLRMGYKVLTLEEDFKQLAGYQPDKSTKYLADIQNHIRRAKGDKAKLLEIEKMMTDLLKNTEATAESKKLVLRELSWMGSEFCIPVVRELAGNNDLRDEVEFALERLDIK